MLLSEKYSIRSFNNREAVNFLLFLTANFTSQLGTAVYSFAVGLYVLKITGSGLSFALNLALSIISTIIVIPFAGVLADRIDKKLISVIMDMLNGIILLGLYLITIRFRLNVPMIYASTFLLNVLTSIYAISVEAAKPNLVSEKRLLSLNSINKILESSSSILGPMAGGIVFAFLDIRLFIIVNGFSFIISGFLEMFIDFKFNVSSEKIEKEKVDFIKDIKGGIDYIKDKKYILSSFGVFIVLNFFIGLSINVPMPFIINNVL
ncbi:MAG: MFS transporter, partial [Bacillota bacterium]|nr:MFS transporter [Bacillota bacterium]